MPKRNISIEEYLLRGKLATEPVERRETISAAEARLISFLKDLSKEQGGDVALSAFALVGLQISGNEETFFQIPEGTIDAK